MSATAKVYITLHDVNENPEMLDAERTVDEGAGAVRYIHTYIYILCMYPPFGRGGQSQQRNLN